MPTECNVILTEVLENKEIFIVKIIHRALGISLKDAKEFVKLVKSEPPVVMVRLSKKETEKFQPELEQAGTKVDINTYKHRKIQNSSIASAYVNFDDATALNNYYLALANIESEYQKFQQAQKEFQWYKN